MNKVNNSHFPVFEWTPPRSAIMGGFTTDSKKLSCQQQYLSYLERLAQEIEVFYFCNKENENVIRSKIESSNIKFFDYQLDSIWIRDYAPIWLQSSQKPSFDFVNFPYGANHFDKSVQDDGFSSELSKILDKPLLLDFPRKHIPFYFDGGNIFVDESMNCFTSIRCDDPPLEFREKLLRNINCNKVIPMHSIPGEGTGHVDMFMKILPDKKVLLAKYDDKKLDEPMKKNKHILENLNYKIIEIPHSDIEGKTSWSYLNSVIIDKKAFIPQYGLEQDLEVLSIYENCNFSAIPIRAEQIMREKGSLHCITNFIY